MSKSDITHELLSSEPAALIVSITPTFKASVGVFWCRLNNHGSKSTLAPQAIALAESITDPPPTANIKSTCSSFTIFTPCLTSAILGFGSTPESSIKSTLALFKDVTTLSYNPVFLIEFWP